VLAARLFQRPRPCPSMPVTAGYFQPLLDRRGAVAAVRLGETTISSSLILVWSNGGH
jgi:hypothetical protein